MRERLLIGGLVMPCRFPGRRCWTNDLPSPPSELVLGPVPSDPYPDVYSTLEISRPDPILIRPLSLY